MILKTKLTAGRVPASNNQNETVARGLRVRTAMKAGEFPPGPTYTNQNHNQTVTGGLRVRTAMKAGEFPPGPS